MLGRHRHEALSDRQVLELIAEGVLVCLEGLAQLREKVDQMSDRDAQLEQDLDDIAAGVTTLANAYTSAAASASGAALADMQKAWEAKDQSMWDAAHSKAQTIKDALAKNMPITPAPTDANPTPAPVPSPADASVTGGIVDGSTTVDDSGAVTPAAPSPDTSQQG